MNAPVTVVLNKHQVFVALSLLTTEIDELRKWRSWRVKHGQPVGQQDTQIADLRELRSLILNGSAPEAGSRLDANIARVRAALEAAE